MFSDFLSYLPFNVFGGGVLFFNFSFLEYIDFVICKNQTVLAFQYFLLFLLLIFLNCFIWQFLKKDEEIFLSYVNKIDIRVNSVHSYFVSDLFPFFMFFVVCFIFNFFSFLLNLFLDIKVIEFFAYDSLDLFYYQIETLNKNFVYGFVDKNNEMFDSLISSTFIKVDIQVFSLIFFKFFLFILLSVFFLFGVLFYSKYALQHKLNFLNSINHFLFLDPITKSFNFFSNFGKRVRSADFLCLLLYFFIDFFCIAFLLLFLFVVGGFWDFFSFILVFASFENVFFEFFLLKTFFIFLLEKWVFNLVYVNTGLFFSSLFFPFYSLYFGELNSFFISIFNKDLFFFSVFEKIFYFCGLLF